LQRERFSYLTALIKSSKKARGTTNQKTGAGNSLITNQKTGAGSSLATNQKTGAGSNLTTNQKTGAGNNNQGNVGRGGSGRGSRAVGRGAGGKKGGRKASLFNDILTSALDIIHHLHSMHDVHSYNQTIPITIIQDGKVLATLRALVDTGALQGNYMSEHAYSKLNGCGFEHNNINIRVCAAFNDCVISTDSLTLTLQFNYNLINLEHFEASLAFNVLNNIQYDLIIGRPSILKYGIWHRTLQPSASSTVNTIQKNVASSLHTIDAHYASKDTCS